MKPADGSIKKFKQEPKYVHQRSEGLTRRHNGGTRALEEILRMGAQDMRDRYRMNMEADDERAG